MGRLLSVFICCLIVCVTQFSCAEDKPAPVAPATTPAPKPENVPTPDAQPAPGTSRDNPASLDPVNVTAPAGALVTSQSINTTPGPVSRNGASITTVTKEEVQQAQIISTAEAIRQTPGVIIGQTGRQGSITNLFIRGGNNNQTEVLIDGFRVNRQGQGYDFDAQDPLGIERIEVSRGMGSALYGSEALSGAVNILTRKGFGGPELTTSVAAGTYHTDRETILMQGACDKFAYNVSSSRLLREGASEPNSRLSAYNYAARFDYDIDCNNTLKLIVRGKDLDRGFYESVSLATQLGTSVVPVDPNDELKAKDVLVGFEYDGKICHIWETSLRAGYYRSEHDFNFPQPTPAQNFLLNNPILGGPRSAQTSTVETRPTLEWRNTVTTFDSDCLRNFVTAGAYLEWETFDQADTVLFARIEFNWKF